jgi:uncharacterized protein (TIGR04255 family)
MIAHPKFARPTVAEALCEIHFALGVDAVWDPAWFGQVHDVLRPGYPTMEPRQFMEWAATVSLDGITQQLAPPQLRMVYRHGERPHLVQLSPGILTVNEIEPYPGWETCSRDVESAWELVAGIVQPRAVNRLGLRYINRIPRQRPDDRVGEWLAQSDYFPARLLTSPTRFLSRFESSPEPGLRLIVTVGDALAPGTETIEADGRDVILDIDAILEAPLSVEWAPLSAEIERLHELVWGVFESSIGPKLQIHLTGATL